MEPLLIILIPGVFGGLVLALLIASRRWTTPPTFVPRRLASPDPALINMASIRVEGIGGMGMVAAVVIVALTDPRIRLAILLAAVLGAGLALVLIARRRDAAFPSTGNGPDDRSLLHLASERRGPSDAAAPGAGGQMQRAGVVRRQQDGNVLVGSSGRQALSARG